jgi:hypothetical protein
MIQRTTDITLGFAMTKTDHLEWASARVDGVEMRATLHDREGWIAPRIQVEIRYSWKGRRFTKTIHSVMN